MSHVCITYNPNANSPSGASTHPLCAAFPHLLRSVERVAVLGRRLVELPGSKTVSVKRCLQTHADPLDVCLYVWQLMQFGQKHGGALRRKEY